MHPTEGVRGNTRPQTLEDVRGMVLIDAAGIPTLSEWGVIALALLMTAGAWTAMHRHPWAARHRA